MQGWVPLLAAMVLSSGTGMLLDTYVQRWDGFGALAVVMAGKRWSGMYVLDHAHSFQTRSLRERRFHLHLPPFHRIARCRTRTSLNPSSLPPISAPKTSIDRTTATSDIRRTIFGRFACAMHIPCVCICCWMDGSSWLFPRLLSLFLLHRCKLFYFILCCVCALLMAVI